MPRANDDVEQILIEYADLLAILSDDAYKARAYEKAGRAVGAHPGDVGKLDAKGLLAIPSVGRSIAEKVREYLDSGTIGALDELRAQIPPGVRDMMSVPGLGPKRAITLYRDLGIDSLETLRHAAEAGTLAAQKGFGAKTQENVLRGLDRLASSGGRVPIGAAMVVAELFLAQLEAVGGVERIAYAGSLRRMAETIGDVDLLVAAADGSAVTEAFVSPPGIGRTLVSGESKTSIVTDAGVQVDLRIVPPQVWGAAMIYFTGSKAHNIRLRERAVRAGLKLNEYGLFRAKSGRLIVAETEEEVYERLDLPWIAPTLREDRGEIEAALEGTLPDLVTQRQIRGDLHTHTDLTDGHGALEEMVEAAAAHRYAYFAVTDHAEQLSMQRMTRDKMLTQRARLASLQERVPKMRVLHGAELNIDPEGGLDWDDAFLEGFEVLVASVHSHFSQSRDQMTRRLLRAIEHPLVNVIGHPTGRKIGRRDPIEFDEEAVFEAAARTGTALEINAHPDRLDLKDEHVLWAKRLGVRFSIDSDAHAVSHLDLLRYGVGTAQRGWLGPDDVINTWPRTKLERFLRAGRSGGAARGRSTS
ncbi:MAG: DNA polymerase/3'-5' exonuclease PolX [Actinomycetota bacterium]